MKREFGIASIFQNEAPYLKEWIDFHRLIGFEFFYLFDHLSKDEPEKILEPYLSEGIVQLVRWPLRYSDVYEWTQVQCLAYERAIHQSAGKTKWLALIDIDEFLFPVQGSLRDVLTPLEPYGGVGVNWQVFGTSNLLRIPEGKRMIEMLTLKADPNQITNHYIKSIVRPERVERCENAHSMVYRPGFHQVNPRGIHFEGCLSPTVEIDLLRINHYTLKDEEFLKTQKIPRLQKWWGENETDMAPRYNEMNQVEDKTIHRYLPFLK